MTIEFIYIITLTTAPEITWWNYWWCVTTPS